MTTPRTPGRHRRPSRRPRATVLIATATTAALGVGGLTWATATPQSGDDPAAPAADSRPALDLRTAAAPAVLPLPQTTEEAAPGVGVAGADVREDAVAASRGLARTALDLEAEDAADDEDEPAGGEPRAAVAQASGGSAEEPEAEEEPEPQPEAANPAPGHEVTSRYGPRWGRMHEGTDFSVVTGTPLVAAQTATVTSATWSDGLGYHIRLETEAGEELVYGHMSELQVEAGQRVEMGERIGLSGNTGRSTGPHLHFEVRVDGVAHDSYTWLVERGAL